MSIPRPRLNLIELALFGCLLIVVTAGVALQIGRVQLAGDIQVFARAIVELRPLRERFGQAHHSRYAEEWIIRDFFKDARDGVFVDVGANHYERDSNTYHLETALGWRGVAIEPQTKFAADYATYRPRTIFVPLFVSDKSNEKAVLYVPSNDLVASSSKAFVASEGGGTNPPAVTVNTTTLDDVLTRAGLDHLDFLSIDVELHEPEVWRGFSLDRWQPRLVCVEAHPDVRQLEIDYFAAHGYVIVGKYLRADPVNLWFARPPAR